MAASDDDLIERYIVPDPRDLGPPEARLLLGGVSVWALIAYMRANKLL